jgi:predicted RNase H-like HicB family nuclease
MRYTVILTPERDGSAINVRVPAMPGVFTWGATPEEALVSAREAIEAYLPQYLERGEPFPRDRKTWQALKTTIEGIHGAEAYVIEVEAPAHRVAS